MRFVADVMLGKLARFLRMVGQDVLYFEDARDEFLIYTAKETGRLLLTRDVGLYRAAVSCGACCLLIRSNYVREQLEEVRGAVALRPARAVNCIRCNGPLKKVDKCEIEGEVPEYVWHTNSEFWVCERCGRVYWRGSHIRNFVRFLGYNPWDNEGPSEREGP